MPLISETIPNLINGVSQQPAPTRIPTACEEAKNCYMSVVSGLQKRQNSAFVSSLKDTASNNIASTVASTNVATHTTKRSDGTENLFIASDQGLHAFNLNTGAAFVIEASASGDAYIKSGSNPSRNIQFVTVGDQSFILNKDVKTLADTPDEGSAQRNDPTKTVSIFIKRAVASSAYAIYINNKLAFSTTTSDNTTADTALEGTSKIAENLKQAAESSSSVRSPDRIGSVITFEKVNADDVISIDDQFGGAAMRVIEDRVQDFSDLPPLEKVGRLAKVVGDADAEGDDYWVRFDGSVWIEDVGWEQRRQLDATTMPHKIVMSDKPGIDFELIPVVWADRLVGDDQSNQDPTFVGKKINSMFLYKGRMGFLTDENLVMSEVGNYENFYRTTATQLLDTDRIDIASTTGRVNILRHAVAFGNSLVVFSDNQQFRVTQGDILSPATVGLQPTTAYDGSRHVPPVNSGPNVFFAVDGPRFAIVREMYIDENNGEQFDAAEVTIQVPKYIPTNVTQLAVSTYEDVLVLLSGDATNTIFIYKWFLDGKTKVQSAWSKWEFPEGTHILSLVFLDQDLIMVYKLNDQIMVDRVRLEEAVSLVDDTPLLLDHQVTEDNMTVTYDQTSDTTTFQVPYQHVDDLQFWTRKAPYGMPLDVVRVAGSQTDYILDGKWDFEEDGTTKKAISAGVPISFEFTFSDQFIRSNTGGGLVAIQDGRLQLRYMSLIYQNSAYFVATVKPKNRDERKYVFTARTLADGTNLLDTVPIETGEFRFPILAQNTKVRIRLESDKPFPCSFGVAEWDALSHPRTRRVS